MAMPSLALTSLLNSLHSHLQTQTQLLPGLHAQLGLPSTALEDELGDLQVQLIQGVEARVDARRKQVEEWMEKCNAVEEQCMRYIKALGGNVKATGSSLGELRKELVLPRRLDMVSEYQEKLRQLYHTKLEQFTTLTNRLVALSRTLGSDFFPPDVIERSPDPTSQRDVTPERFLKLEKELVRGKAEVAKRLAQLSSIMIQIDWLYSELGIPHPALDDFSTSPANSFTSSSADPFLAASTSTPTPLSRTKAPIPLLFANGDTSSEADYQKVFAKFVARMEETESEGLPTPESMAVVGLEGVEPTMGLITWAQSTCNGLEETKRRREAHIQAMYDQLDGLWRRLGVSERDMDAFVEAHRGSTDVIIKEYEDELERMMDLKRERMSVFVGSAREEILRLWDELMVGEEERADFAPLADDEHTEELLTIHEDEIRRLKDERRIKAPLLASIKKYFDICEEEKELAAAASDQTRLLGRGRDPGRLLREEKMRKRVSKEKPRLEQDLLASIPAWEDEYGREFLVHGESILKFLRDTVSAADQENNKKPRAGSVPARAKTPVNSTNHYVPGSAGHAPTKTGVVTPAVRPGSTMGSNSLPNKRQKLTDGSSTVAHGHGTAPRAPLGPHRSTSQNIGHGHRGSPPTKGKTPLGGSSLPRPVAISMPVPKLGTQHHALGHGRVPSGMEYGVGGIASYQRERAASNSTAAGQVRKTSSSRLRRESFKPRASTEGRGGEVVSLGARMKGFAGMVKEEEEGY